MYVFDDEDPLVEAYQRLFPESVSPGFGDARGSAGARPLAGDAVPHAGRNLTGPITCAIRNRSTIAPIYGTLRPLPPAREASRRPVPPTYMIATLPGETQPEFLLTFPFTPRNKQNLIGLMVARCDGPHLGELVFLDLPKQEIIPGPLQIEALINQDQTISKDLTLWNQQGSQVLRSQILTLPIDQTFLYVAPIYIQASQARMPQLKKVALVVGNTLVYADTYEQALAELEAIQKGAAPPRRCRRRTHRPRRLRRRLRPADARIEEIRQHSEALSRFRRAGQMGRRGQRAGGDRGGGQQVRRFRE